MRIATPNVGGKLAPTVGHAGQVGENVGSSRISVGSNTGRPEVLAGARGGYSEGCESTPPGDGP